jgi:hypothetical protein
MDDEKKVPLVEPDTDLEGQSFHASQNRRHVSVRSIVIASLLTAGWVLLHLKPLLKPCTGISTAVQVPQYAIDYGEIMLCNSNLGRMTDSISTARLARSC